MYTYIDIKNISGSDISYGTTTIVDTETLNLFIDDTPLTYTETIYIMDNYRVELYNDFNDGNIEIITNTGTLSTSDEINELYEMILPSLCTHRVSYTDNSMFYFDIGTNQFMCKNPLTGKTYSIQLTEV